MTKFLLTWGPRLTAIYRLTLRDLREMTPREISAYIDYAAQQHQQQKR